MYENVEHQSWTIISWLRLPGWTSGLFIAVVRPGTGPGLLPASPQIPGNSGEWLMEPRQEPGKGCAQQGEKNLALQMCKGEQCVGVSPRGTKPNWNWINDKSAPDLWLTEECTAIFLSEVWCTCSSTRSRFDCLLDSKSPELVWATGHTELTCCLCRFR